MLASFREGLAVGGFNIDNGLNSAQRRICSHLNALHEGAQLGIVVARRLELGERQLPVMENRRGNVVSG